MNQQQIRASVTRQHILDAAQRCFAESGYEGASVSEICEAAHITKGAFYYHFETKHDLFMALLEQWLTGLDAQLAAARNSENTLQVFNQIGALAEQVFASAAGNLPMFLEFWSRAARDPQTWQATIAPYHRYQDYFHQQIQAGIDEGALEPIDARTASYTLMAMMVGMVLQGLLDPQGADWASVTRESLRLFIEGLKRRDS